MRRFVFALLVVAGWGCGASAGGSGASGPGALQGDGAAAIAAALPPGANRCAVARPGRLPDSRRSLFLRLSQSDPIAWTPGAPFSAVGVAERVGPDGRRSVVALARLTADPPTVRAWLEERSPTRIRWRDDVAEGEGRLGAGADPRSFIANFEGSRVLRLRLGPWTVERNEGPGAEMRCAELARSFPEAVEVASRHGEMVVVGAHAHLPRITEVVIAADEDAVAVTRQVHMASPRQAEERRRELDVVEPVVLSMMGSDLFPDSVEHRREGNVLSTRLRILWEDLVLAVEDQRRMAAAAIEDERRHQPQPPEAVEVSNLAVLQHQLALWSQRVTASRGARRRAAADRLAALLRRAVAAHPSELELARQLARLHIDELEDGAAAVAVVEAVLQQGPGEPESWRVLRREATALLGAEELAAALVHDEIVAESHSRRAAADLVRLRRQGVAYEFAEGAWIAAEAIGDRADELRLRDVAPTSIPLESLTDTLAMLTHVGGERHSPAALYVLGRGERGSYRPTWNPESTPVVEVRDEEGERRLVGVATTTDPRVRAVGRSVADGFLLGPVELVIYVVPFGGSPSEPEVAVRLAGTLAHDAFVLERASGGAARIDWREVARLLAMPLQSLEPRVFPPPELVLAITDEREAAALSDIATAQGAVRCAFSESRVRCTSAPESPGAAREVLRRFAGARLERAARLLRQ